MATPITLCLRLHSKGAHAASVMGSSVISNSLVYGNGARVLQLLMSSPVHIRSQRKETCEVLAFELLWYQLHPMQVSMEGCLHLTVVSRVGTLL